MVKYRVVKETQANGTTLYYPERKVLWLFWCRYYECGEWVHVFGSEQGAWHHISSVIVRSKDDKTKRKGLKVVKREVLK